MSNQQLRNPQPNQLSANYASISLDTIIRGAFPSQSAQYPSSPQIIAHNRPQNVSQTYRPQRTISTAQQLTPIKRIEPALNTEKTNLNTEKPAMRRVVMPSQAGSKPPLPSERRVEYVPYQQRYLQYVEQRVRVPVQKLATDYYQVEHIIDYVPIEKAETVYVTQPQEVVNMRLQYVPVEQRIIHIKQEDARMLGIQQGSQLQYHGPLTMHEPRNMPAKDNTYLNISKSKTNFVTAEGFDPNQKLKQIDRVLAASAVRESRAKASRQQSLAGSSARGSVAELTDMKKKESIYDAIATSFKDLGKQNSSIRGSHVH